MEIKSETLKSLYEDLISGVFSFGMSGEDPIDVLFKKCDDELEKEKEKLMKDLEDNVLAHYKINQLEGENAELRKKCTYFEKLSTERLKATEELHQQLDTAEKEINELKKQITSLENELEEEHKARIARDELCVERGKRICNLMREKEDLKRQLDTECKKRCDIGEQLDDIGKRYYEGAKRVGRLVREKEDLNRQFGRLRERYEEEVVCRRKWAKLAGYRDKRIEELLKTGYGIDADEVYKLKGMEELWGMLGTMYAADPIEVSKIFGWFSINNIAHYTPDVRDFLKKYETWKGEEDKDEEQKSFEEMIDYLHRFCLGKVCCGCPLNTPEFKCHVRGEFDSISYEDLKRYYEKARGCGRFSQADKKYAVVSGLNWLDIETEDLKRYYEKARGCGRFSWADKKEEEKTVEEVPCSFNWKLDGTEYTIETSIPRKDYDNIVKIISGKE